MRTPSRLRFSLSGLAVSALALSGCAALGVNNFGFSGGSTDRWMNDGALALSRPVPMASVELNSTEGMFGFMPTAPARVGRWLKIDRSRRTIDLMDGRTSLASAAGDGLQSLAPGKYTVQHKQRSPVWYASDEYFEMRELDVPGNGETARFRRGALGPLAIFLDQETPLHSGPVWREEIGGVQLTQADLEKIFEGLDVGTTVEVR